MAKKQSQTEEPKAPANLPEKPPAPKAELAMTAMGFQPTSIEAAYRYADTMAASIWVKPEFRGKPANCMVLLDVSMKMGVPWLYLMQHLYFVHECPALDGQITISLINQKGGFTDPLDYEVVGDDAEKDNYKVRAYATRKSTGKVLHGPWITWKLVRAEGWHKRSGSKWLTMPEQMFHYRAASWFANRHCPEVKMGMTTVEEAEELPAKHVESTVVTPGVEGLKARLAEKNGTQTPPEDAEAQEPEDGNGEDATEEPDAETKEKVAAQKEALGLSPQEAEETASNLFG